MKCYNIDCRIVSIVSAKDKTEIFSIRIKYIKYVSFHVCHSEKNRIVWNRNLDSRLRDYEKIRFEEVYKENSIQTNLFRSLMYNTISLRFCQLYRISLNNFFHNKFVINIHYGI